MNSSTINCPHCGKPIAIEDALSHQIKAELEANLAKQFANKEQDLIATTKAKVREELEVRLKTLESENIEKDTKLKEAREAELAIRKLASKLEDDKKSFELDKLRQLDAERAKIREQAEKLATEASQLKILEVEKKLADALKTNDDMKRKLQQGSQQTQGEVLELELENQLRTEFPQDDITPVAKGVRGADVLQIVKDRQGKICGSILWELKNAQWSEKWLNKLRDDQRVSKADLAVLVSINLPETIPSFSFIKGVWVTSRPLSLALASALRIQLNQVFTARAAGVGKGEKMEILYSYLSGNEFRQRVGAIVETFVEMQADLESEKRLFAKKWAKEEKNIRKVIDHTLGFHGDLQSIMGASLPEIEQLTLDSGKL